ncbi:MAG: hypothetical protein A2Z83_04295 [Omnitrophica bacterium GWA2_52_8]|nr:MAG: hypothetical protein A2Z83_04295 [Omnitrophica bacterium GWA2_52_8]
MTAWVTFAPCFLWIFLGAPSIEHLRGNKPLSSALSAITAAVVGVMLNLAVWFFLHVVFWEVREVYVSGMRFFVPVWETLDIFALLIAGGALLAVLKFKRGMIPVLGASALAGVLLRYFFGS